MLQHNMCQAVNKALSCELISEALRHAETSKCVRAGLGLRDTIALFIIARTPSEGYTDKPARVDWAVNWAVVRMTEFKTLLDKALRRRVPVISGPNG